MKIEPPMKPVVTAEDDFGNVDKEFLDEEVRDTPVEDINGARNTCYNGFTYANPKLVPKEGEVQI